MESWMCTLEVFFVYLYIKPKIKPQVWEQQLSTSVYKHTIGLDASNEIRLEIRLNYKHQRT